MGSHSGSSEEIQGGAIVKNPGNYNTDYDTIKTIALERISFYSQCEICRELIADKRLNIHIFDGYIDRIILRLEAEILGKTTKEISVSYPADWWEAVKERFAPLWIKRKYPIKYKTIKLTAKECYPLIAIPEQQHSLQFCKTEVSPPC
jgi:hypothetical protein